MIRLLDFRSFLLRAGLSSKLLTTYVSILGIKQLRSATFKKSSVTRSKIAKYFKLYGNML